MADDGSGWTHDDTGIDERGLDLGQRLRLTAQVNSIKTTAQQIADLFAEVDGLHLGIDEFLERRARLGDLFVELNDLSSAVTKLFGLSSAQQRMYHYLIPRVGEQVSAAELGGVSCIWEWARRLRELRVEKGFQIQAGPTTEVAEGMYKLVALAADEEQASRWQIRNEVRRMPGSGLSRCLEYLRRIYPAVASKEDLAYVARINEWSRRMRELAEAGWPLVSSNDDPTLPPGSYRLDSPVRGPARKRRAIALRHQLLERDNWTCQKCGATPFNTSGTKLEVHHRRHVQHGGDNAEENLITLCSFCHAGVHTVENGTTADELLEPDKDPWGGEESAT